MSDELKVPRGQVTFDAEGNDIEGSPWFSRVAHWPGGVSGVTIGRGYDLGNRGDRATIEKEFADSGIDFGPWAGSVGLKGGDAEAWYNANKAALPTITREQQKKLFAFSYDALAADVKRLATKPDVEKVYGKTDFATLHPAILDIVVDMRFRGDYAPWSRKLMQTAMANNDLPGFAKILSDRSKWANVPEDRFKRRVQFLEAALKESGGAAPSPASDQGAKAGAQTYVVQQGEGLLAISRKFGVSEQALKDANADKLKTWGEVQGFNVGEEIAIPVTA